MKRIVILLLVITGLYIVFNKGFDIDQYSAAGKDAQAAISKDTDMIEINVSNGSTTIIPQNRNNLKAVYNGKEKLTVKENGDKVEVSLKNKWFDWFNWLSFSKHKELKIYIPEDYDRSIAINLGSGNFSFSGHSKNKPVKLEDLSVDIGSGNMNLKNLDVKDFEHNGASGNVKIDSLKTKTGSVDLSSGNLTINHYTGAMKADVSSGRFNLQMDKLTDSIDIDLSSGTVGLDLPKNADFTLNGDVSSGTISCVFPLTTKDDVNRKSIKGKHGSGKYKIDLSVSSGNIHIN
jgi:lia operon protein LiaG